MQCAISPEDGKRMPDYMYQLESRLSAEQRAALVRIQELALASESNLYLVGGAVRDMISGMPIRDLDFTVEGNPSRIVRELEKGGAQVTSEDESLRIGGTASCGRSGRQHLRGARRCLRASRSEIRSPLFDHHGGSEAPGFFHQRHRDFPECEFQRSACSIPPTGLPIWSAAKFGRYPFIASPISRSGCCARCATRRAWISRWIPARRSGSTWPWNASCKRRFLRKMRAANFGNLRGKKNRSPS